MSFWLVCKKCNANEWRPEWKSLEPCSVCGAARCAVGNDGKPLYVWTDQQDLTSWDIDKDSGCL